MKGVGHNDDLADVDSEEDKMSVSADEFSVSASQESEEREWARGVDSAGIWLKELELEVKKQP